MKNKICMVTGANSGIGKATAMELARQGATLVMVCRNEARGKLAQEDIQRTTGNEDVHLLLADLSSLADMRTMTDAFKQRFSALHVLVNNAGLFLSDYRTSVDGLELTFATNHFGYFYTTALLLDILKGSAPARIINVASAAHIGAKIDYNNITAGHGYAGWRAYSQSKLANILFTKELARQLAGAHINVNAVHPGVVGSNFGQSGGKMFRSMMNLAKRFLTSNERGAATSIYLAASADAATFSGDYFANCTRKRPSREARREQAASDLWAFSETFARTHESGSARNKLGA